MTYSLPWQRRCVHRQLHQVPPGSMPNNVESSLLLDECRCHVAYSHPLPPYVNPCFLGSSLSSCPMHISVQCQFWISGMIHSLHMTKILHSPLLYTICYVKYMCRLLWLCALYFIARSYFVYGI